MVSKHNDKKRIPGDFHFATASSNAPGIGAGGGATAGGALLCHVGAARWTSSSLAAPPSATPHVGILDGSSAIDV